MTAGSFTMPRAHVRDFDVLSLDTVGLLAWLSSHTDTFVSALTEERIRAAVKVGRDKCRRMLRELSQAGHLTRLKIVDRIGMTIGVRYILNRRADRQAAMFDPTLRNGQPVLPDDQGKHDVSAAPQQDWKPVLHSSYREDTERSTKGALSVTHADAPDPTPAPPPHTPQGSSMPEHRQTRMAIIVPKKPTPGRDIERRGDLPIPASIEPAIASRELQRRTAVAIVGEWLDRCRKTPPSRIVAEVEAQVRCLIADAIDDNDIRRGMALWMAKGYSPGAIPSFVHQAMNAPTHLHTVRRDGLVEHDGMMLRPDTVEAMSDVARFAEMDRQRAAAAG